MSFQMLTLAEVETIEDILGQSMPSLFKDGEIEPTAKMIKAFALVILRRTNPATTAEDVAELQYEEAVNIFKALTEDDDAPKVTLPPPAPSDTPPSSAPI